MIEERKANMMFNKNGNGSVTTRITIPVNWARQLGFTEEHKNGIMQLNENKIIIEKEENKMKVKEILENIRGNGGFDNFSNWNAKEIAEWVESNFDCTKYVAKQVACELQ